MIDITNREDRCHMLGKDGCRSLRKTKCDDCKFYKPYDCNDWIRVDQGDKILLYEPEEKGFVRCRSCRHHRLDAKSDIHYLCAMYEERIMPLYGYCSEGEKIR